MKHFTITLEDDEVKSIQQTFEQDIRTVNPAWTAALENAILVKILEQIVEQTEPLCNVDLGGEG